MSTRRSATRPIPAAALRIRRDPAPREGERYNDPVPAFACRSVRIRPPPALRASATVAAWSSAPVLIGTLLRSALLHEAGVPWQYVGFSCALAAFAWFVFARARPVSGHVLEFVGDSIRIHPVDGRRTGRRRTVTPRSIDDAYVTPSRLVLRLRSGATIEADFEAESARDVARYLTALQQRVLRTPLEAQAVASFNVLEVLLLTWFCGFTAGLGVWLSSALAIACSVAVGRWVGWYLETGGDGVRIRAGARSRTIPYRTITRVGRTRRRILLHTAAGTIRTPRIDDSEEAVSALASRIEERRAAAGRAPALAALDRGERSVQDWHAALDDLALGRGGFRGAALSEDDLDSILKDPGAPLDRRIGAALALRSRGQDARARIRVAAETSVERRVRVALEAAAADEIDDRTLERALDAPEPARAVAAHDPHDPHDPHA